jgi:hypothetical protein
MSMRKDTRATPGGVVNTAAAGRRLCDECVAKQTIRRRADARRALP